MTTLWIEPFGGLAGDMLLAALLDLDDERFGLADLRGLADRLVPGEATLETETVWRGSLRGRRLEVRTHESGTTTHRGLAELVELLRAASLEERVLERATGALEAMAHAEARVHGCSVEEVHFHEVGAVDTLVDVAGAALALERLGVDEVRFGVPLVGSGIVRCAHGEMPVPAPAVAELLRGRPVQTGGGCERTTPTGAAMLVAWDAQGPVPRTFTASSIGYGAGSRDPEEGPPNLLRVQLGEVVAVDGEGESSDAVERREAWMLEANLDDQPAEEIGHALARLRDAGALEVWSVPAQMKKDRPGVVVCALTRPEHRGDLERVLFDWTTTFGVRWTRLERRECEREFVTVEVEGARVRVKVRHRPGSEPGERDLFPEHDDLERVASDTGSSLGELRRRAIAEAALRLGLV